MNNDTDLSTFSTVVDSSTYDTEGFCKGFELRRHKYECEANEGSRQARSDWIGLIGPIEKFGNYNPYSGHFAALVLPQCIPQRLRLISYIFEYAFIYDQHLESAEKATFSKDSENAGLDEVELRSLESTMGTKQMQSKMQLALFKTDPLLAKVVVEAWKEMVTTTAKLDKKRIFDNLEEYVEYRIVDTGAPFVDTLMRFGMGIFLTKDEERLTHAIAHECYTALGLANDFFSFDEEWESFQHSDETTLTNAIWLFMQWYNVEAATAKAMVRDTASRYEQQFLRLKNEFLQSQKCNEKLQKYLEGLAYQVSGNVAWSLTCPRYHRERRYDLSVGANIPDEPIIGQKSLDAAVSSVKFTRRPSSDSEISVVTDSSFSDAGSLASSTSLRSSNTDLETPRTWKSIPLGSQHVNAPFYYISSLPSKDVRDTFIDALNVWLNVPQDTIGRIKAIINTLHEASLMLDDIEDFSPLRRGKPSTHMVYGTAQTINSASYYIVSAIEQAATLDSACCLQVTLQALEEMHIGQSWDLHWTQSGRCPTEEEYLSMVDKKTGGLFELAARLMQAHSSHNVDFGSLLIKLGRLFQIRDDYVNLADADFSTQKGFCEDLDEGKFSFPLILALKLNQSGLRIETLLQQRRGHGGLSKEQKLLVLEDLEKTESLEVTRTRLDELQRQVQMEIQRVECATGNMNWVLRLLVYRLRIQR